MISDGDAGLITAAAANAGNWGIRLMGKAMDFTVGKIQNKVSKWDLSLNVDSFGATPLTNAQAATVGTGTTNQIAELEWFLSGNMGELFRMGEPNIFTATKMVVDGVTYDMIAVQYEEGRKDSLGYVNSPQVLTLAIPNTTPDWATGPENITDVLEVLVYGAVNGKLEL
mgnify:FL=1